MLNSGNLPDNWKRKNIVLVYKKGNKQLILMLSMLSLLSISSKIFYRLAFNSLYKLIEQNIFPL